MRNFKLLSRAFLSIAVFMFALGILLTSVFRSAQIRYSFEPSLKQNPEVLGEMSVVDYELPYPGKVNPDSVLWPVKVARDKLWLGMTTNTLKSAEISLLFANKRMASALKSAESGDISQAIETAEKAEIYLNDSMEYATKAGDEGMDISSFLLQLSQASLKHREVLENFVEQSPEDARPLLNQMIGETYNVYSKCMQELNERGIPVPVNPFNMP